MRVMVIGKANEGAAKDAVPTVEAFAAMDKFTEEVRRGVEGAESIGGQMEDIITQVTSVTSSFESVAEAMRVGLEAAARAGARQITAGNYGGSLGEHHFHLRELVP